MIRDEAERKTGPLREHRLPDELVRRVILGGKRETKVWHGLPRTGAALR
jgi:hypothetical protein